MPEHAHARIRLARRRAGMTQAGLAAALTISRSAVGNWEQGECRPSAVQLLKIASITGTSFEWLACGRGAMPGHVVAAGEAARAIESRLLRAYRGCRTETREALLQLIEAQASAKT